MERRCKLDGWDFPYSNGCVALGSGKVGKLSMGTVREHELQGLRLARGVMSSLRVRLRGMSKDSYAQYHSVQGANAMVGDEPIEKDGDIGLRLVRRQ